MGIAGPPDTFEIESAPTRRAVLCWITGRPMLDRLAQTSGVARIAQVVISLVAIVSLLAVRYARPWFTLPRDRI